jgi:type I restriction enzyme S subunit
MHNQQLPSDWSFPQLESVAKVRTGLALGKREIANPVRLPCLRVANVQDGHLNLDEIKHVSVGVDEVDRYSLAKGDILLTEGGDFDKLGRGTMWRGEITPCLHQNHIFVVRTERTKLLPEYLEWLTSSPYGRWYFRKCSKQSTNLASINTSQLRAFPIPLPPHREQLAIAEVLHTWDRGLADTERAIKLKRRLKRSLMQQLLTGRRRFPDFVGRPWREVRLGDLLKEQHRGVSWDDDAMYNLVSIRRRSGGFFRRKGLKGSQIKTKVMQSVKTGDFVIARMQVIHGAMAMVKPDFDGMNVSDSYTILVPRRVGELHMPFLDYFSQTPSMYYKAWRSSYGVAIEKMTFNLDWFMRESLTIPPTLAEQQQIAAVLATADREIELLEQQLAMLREQKKGLMQKLLTGQVRVKVPTEKS